MKIKISKEKDLAVFFNYKKGTTLILGESYYRAKGPVLLDVSITNRCNRGCPFCYRHAKPIGNDIGIDDYKRILEQAKQCGVNQIAIGGGEPTLHPSFSKILQLTNEAGIIPNYSTNADFLTDNVIEATQKYCGSIAISVYDDIEKYESIVSRLNSFGIIVNLHFILTSNGLEKYLRMLLQPPKWFAKINALIFLNYKPTNGFEHCLSKSDLAMIKAFFDAIENFSLCSIGFDSCTISFIAEYMSPPKELLTFCESARYSAFINENMEVLPCSFYCERGANLRNVSLEEIWLKDKLFVHHRNFKREKCNTCHLSRQCRFGCPIYNISICDR